MINLKANIKKYRDHTGATTDSTAPTIAARVTIATKTNIT